MLSRRNAILPPRSARFQMRLKQALHRISISETLTACRKSPSVMLWSCKSESKWWESQRHQPCSKSLRIRATETAQCLGKPDAVARPALPQCHFDGSPFRAPIAPTFSGCEPRRSKTPNAVSTILNFTAVASTASTNGITFGVSMIMTAVVRASSSLQLTVDAFGIHYPDLGDGRSVCLHSKDPLSVVRPVACIHVFFIPFGQSHSYPIPTTETRIIRTLCCGPKRKTLKTPVIRHSSMSRDMPSKTRNPVSCKRCESSSPSSAIRDERSATIRRSKSSAPLMGRGWTRENSMLVCFEHIIDSPVFDHIRGSPARGAADGGMQFGQLETVVSSFVDNDAGKSAGFISSGGSTSGAESQVRIAVVR